MAKGIGPDLDGCGTGVVAGVEPALDAGAVVGDSGAEADRGFHEIKRNRAREESGNVDA